jgi:hypothetical protein
LPFLMSRIASSIELKGEAMVSYNSAELSPAGEPPHNPVSPLTVNGKKGLIMSLLSFCPLSVEWQTPH